VCVGWNWWLELKGDDMTETVLKAIEVLVLKRKRALEKGEIAEALALEADLKRINVRLVDTPHGTRWSVG
jgi:cysteinyl-tRNA synthetase